MPKQRRILTLHPNHVPNYGIGYAAYALSNTMRSEQFSSLMISSSISPHLNTQYQKSYIPKYLNKLTYKILPGKAITKATEKFFLKQLQEQDIAYLWPSCSLELFQEVKDKGNTILMESINCHQSTCMSILDRESIRLNIASNHQINNNNITDENHKLTLCDYVFSPSPLVTQSLLNNHVPSNKIIQTSYGLERHQQLPFKIKNQTSNDSITAIFVGRVGMRKGIHLLLDYWQKAHVKATLKVIGDTEENMQELISSYKNQSNIEFIHFTSNLERVYADADFFILPSLEEGSPLVTYLALGAGLPCLLSPMAGEGMIKNKEHGYIIEPHNEADWVSAIQELSTSATLRHQQSKAALTLSEQFLWENVGRQRSQALFQRLEGS